MYAQASFDEPADTDMEIEPPNQDNDWTWPEELALHEGAERPGWLVNRADREAAEKEAAEKKAAATKEAEEAHRRIVDARVAAAGPISDEQDDSVREAERLIATQSDGLIHAHKSIIERLNKSC